MRRFIFPTKLISLFHIDVNLQMCIVILCEACIVQFIAMHVIQRLKTMHCDRFVNFLTDFMLLSRHKTVNQKGPSVFKFYFPFWKFRYLSNNLLKIRRQHYISVCHISYEHSNSILTLLLLPSPK